MAMANYGMAALREKNFRRLFLAQTASALGNALVPVAIAFAVLDLTDSPTALGIVLGTRAATQLLFILAGGVIADRFPRRVVMIAADGVRCLTGAAVGMLLLVAHPSLWTLVVLFGIDGIAAAVFTPAAAGMTPAVVSPGNLQQANMLQAMTQSAAAIASPAIAGVLVVTAGPGWAVLATAASLAVGLVFLGRIRVDRPPRPADPHFLRELRQGWDELRGRTWFWAVVLSSTAVNGLIGVYMVLGPQASRQFYGGAAVWAAAVTSRRRRRGARRVRHDAPAAAASTADGGAAGGAVRVAADRLRGGRAPGGDHGGLGARQRRRPDVRRRLPDARATAHPRAPAVPRLRVRVGRRPAGLSDGARTG
nr:hypothetical protein GCM10020092_078410 [Actinoplanes digitatis]